MGSVGSKKSGRKSKSSPSPTVRILDSQRYHLNIFATKKYSRYIDLLNRRVYHRQRSHSQPSARYHLNKFTTQNPSNDIAYNILCFAAKCQKSARNCMHIVKSQHATEMSHLKIGNFTIANGTRFQKSPSQTVLSVQSQCATECTVYRAA